MRKFIIELLVLCAFYKISSACLNINVKNNYKTSEVEKCLDESDSDGPLILTSYLKKGQIDGARAASSVSSLIGQTISYSGYFTVDDVHGSNLFFWYFPAEKSPEHAPLVVWLNGGPGFSSLFGLFFENGPYKFDANGSLKKRDVYWSETMHVVYIDNPVGTGFSFTANKTGLLRDESSVGKYLHIALQQFFTVFPELKKNDFFLAGESYAGKYIPALGHAIHENNLSGKDKINLMGIAIGNGFVDPINQLDYGDYLLNIGLIDEKQKRLYDKLKEKSIKDIEMEDWKAAAEDLNNFVEENSLLYNLSGFTNYYNYLINSDSNIDSRQIHSFLDSSDVRKKIHVGDQKYNYFSYDVGMALLSDTAKSVAPWLSILADNYRVLLYNGQLDIIVAYPLTVNYVNKLKWCGALELTAAYRKQFHVGNQLAGYVTTSAPDHCNGSISLALIRNAGHMVPSDQPLWAYHLITRFTENKL